MSKKPSKAEFDEREDKITEATALAVVARDAVEFAFFVLERALRGKARKHATAAELVRAWVEEGIDRFGLCARAVFREWGVHGSACVGAVFHALIRVDLLCKQENDDPRDFEGEQAAIFDCYLSAASEAHVAALTCR